MPGHSTFSVAGEAGAKGGKKVGGEWRERNPSWDLFKGFLGTA
jgi:hypothetical protein